MFNNRFTKKDSVVDAVSQVLEAWDDDEDDDVKRADAELRRMKAKPIEADKKTDPDKEIGKLAKKTPKEVDESVEQIDELSKKTLANYMRANTKRMADPKNPDSMERKMKRHDDYFKASKKFHEDTVTEDKWTDVADGPWKKSKRTPGQASSAAANAAGKGLKGAQHKLDVAEPKGKLTAADFKKLRKEESEQIDEISGELAVKYKKKALGGKSYDDDSNWNELSRKRQKGIGLANRKLTQSLSKTPGKHAKVAATWKEEVVIEKTLTPAESKKKEEIVKSMKKGASGFKERYGKRAKEVMYATATKQAKKVAEETVTEAQGPTSTYSSDTFVQNANTTSNPTPLSRAKELARTAMSRMKNEMLGKAGTTSEEIDPSVKSTDTLKGRVAGGKKTDVGPGADGKSTKVKFIPGPK